ncbi:MAG TPA: DUF1330 domain-containing protein [Thermohalobaculum sp.]|nr:DUF1330 domain-containing protein [Thermohalobaculum sp.]
MPKGYWIAHVHVTDPEAYKKYVDGARAAFEKHGARILARGGRYEEVEGPLGRERHVVIEFPSLQAALDCYHGEDYQAVRRFRADAGVASIVLVEGS